MRINNAFLLGLITGVGIGYYLAAENKEELMEGVKGTVNKVKDVVEQGVERGKRLVSDMKSKAGEATEYNS